MITSLARARTNWEESGCPSADLIVDWGAVLSHISHHELGACTNPGINDHLLISRRWCVASWIVAVAVFGGKLGSTAWIC